MNEKIKIGLSKVGNVINKLPFAKLAEKYAAKVPALGKIAPFANFIVCGVVVAGTLTFAVAGGGGKISGTYTATVKDIEQGYTFKGNKATYFTSEGVSKKGTFLFDEEVAALAVYFDDHKVDSLQWDKQTGNLSTIEENQLST